MQTRKQIAQSFWLDNQFTEEFIYARLVEVTLRTCSMTKLWTDNPVDAEDSFLLLAPSTHKDLLIGPAVDALSETAAREAPNKGCQAIFC